MTDENGAKMGQLLKAIPHNVKKKAKFTSSFFAEKLPKRPKQKLLNATKRGLIKTRTH